MPKAQTKSNAEKTKTQTKQKNIIILEYRRMFHRHLFYPVNELGQKMATFRGRMSFVYDEIEFLKSIGFEIEVIVPAMNYKQAMAEASSQQLKGRPRKPRTKKVKI